MSEPQVLLSGLRPSRHGERRTTVGVRGALLGLLLVGLHLLGLACQGRNLLALDTPVDGHLVDDPVPVVSVAARVGTNYDPDSVAVRIDGVDLVSALGLTPPFSDESGVVNVNGTPVTVSGFTFELGFNPRPLSLAAAGLPAGAHTVELAATNAKLTTITRSADIEIIGPMTLELTEATAAGLPLGPESAGAEGTLVNASLGQPLAAPPVPVANGGEVRPGFVPAASARAAGGTP